MIRDNLDVQFIRVADVGAGGAVIVTILGYLPAVAALLGILWYAILIYESRTVQHMLKRRRLRRAARRRHKAHLVSGQREHKR